MNVLKKQKPKLEFRNYIMPVKTPIMALLGDRWTMTYRDGQDHLHYHNYFEIGFCCFGQGIMTIGEDRMEFNGGEFTVIPPDFAHSTNSISDTVSSWEYLIVDMEKIIQEKYGKDTMFAGQVLQKVNARAFMGKDEAEYAVISARIQEILGIFRKSDELYYEEARSLFDALVVSLVRANRQEDEIYCKTEKKTTFDIAQSLDYINKHYMDELRISTLAEQNHFSETHFRRVFHTYMGMGPLEYINKVRVHAACEYLRTTDKSVVDIANLCGFSTVSTFNRNFSHITGKSPCRWRKEISDHR